MTQTNTKKKYARPRRPRVATVNTPTLRFSPNRPEPDPADLPLVDDDACLTQVDDACLTQVDDACLTQVDETTVTDAEAPGWPELDDPIWAELGDLDWPHVEDVSRPEVEEPTAAAVDDINPTEPVQLFRPTLRLVPE